MAVTAEAVKTLRDRTGAGIIDCKKALAESDGDFEKAVEILRKKGAAVATKRADKEAKEGIISAGVFNGGKSAVMFEVNCETDFVARSDDFKAFADFVLNSLLAKKYTSKEEFVANPEVAQKLNDILGKCAEKIEVTRFAYIDTADGYVAQYIHNGSKLGVLVQFEGVGEAVATTGKDIAMQVAAMNPITVRREEVSQDTINSEIEIYKELLRKEGKPENMLDKIAQGKINKFFQENCLLEQVFVKDNSKTVGALLEEFNKANSVTANLVKFIRYDLKDANK